jgi:Brp/Blh family beta-carotene 15,15'-monooxygenase
VVERQGRWFAAVCGVASGYAALWGWPGGEGMLWGLAALIVLLGVPHGALDTVYAGRVCGVRGVGRWLLFTSGYLAPVVVVILCWPRAPWFFLPLFLMVSVAHFSGDPEAGCPGWLRVVYGGAPVVLPVLRHGAEVEQLFAVLSSAEVAGVLRASLGWVGWLWLVALGCGMVRQAGRDRPMALEMGAVGMLCTVVPPLASFTLFFCGMHSARHILRSWGEARGAEVAELAWAGVAPMVGTLGILAGSWFYVGEGAVEPRLLQTVFVSLAALTFPHVVLIDLIFGRRWGRGAV